MKRTQEASDKTIVGPRRWRIGLGAATVTVASVLLVTQIGMASPTATRALVSSHVYSVPGVISTESLATVFSCTNGASGHAADMLVSVVDEEGGSLLQGAAEIPVGATRNFATGPLSDGIAVDVELRAPEGGSQEITHGSARIEFNAPPGVYCAAFVADRHNDPPSVMMNLPVMKGVIQQGA